MQKLWEEYIRNTTPLFEPISDEYNGPVCEETFEMMLRMNGFGPRSDIPAILRGQSVRFEFDSPLTVAASRASVQAFTQVGQITQLAVSMDPTVVHDLDIDVAYRDALDGAGAAATWITPKAQADKLKAQDRQRAAAQRRLSSRPPWSGRERTSRERSAMRRLCSNKVGVLPQQPSTAGRGRVTHADQARPGRPRRQLAHSPPAAVTRGRVEPQGPLGRRS